MDPRDPAKVQHIPAGIICFRIMRIAAGYADGNDSVELGNVDLSMSPSIAILRRVRRCARRQCPTTVPDDSACDRPVEGAPDQVSLPVAGNQPRFDVFGTMDNPHRFRDHSRPSQGDAP